MASVSSTGRESRLRDALEAIEAGGDCRCDHDDENCCVRMEEYCPTCIAAVALAAASDSPAAPPAGDAQNIVSAWLNEHSDFRLSAKTEQELVERIEAALRSAATTPLSKAEMAERMKVKTDLTASDLAELDELETSHPNLWYYIREVGQACQLLQQENMTLKASATPSGAARATHCEKVSDDDATKAIAAFQHRKDSDVSRP